MNMILYEDREILVCEKPAGVLSEEGGLPELLKAESGAKEIYCVHRLDRETAGLMVYTKTKGAAAKLSAAIAARGMHKSYLAVAAGSPEDTGELRDLLYRDAKKNKSYVVNRMRRGVREAVLRYEKCEQREGLCLLQIELETGRSHQIRVQFASRGFPLVGDGKYGSAYRDCPLALFAASLAFPHPKSGELLSFRAEPPALWPWTLFETCSQTESPG